MFINEKTKISAIIKHNPKAIDVIASINKHFNKLRNPILRKVLAPRVCIADAARIGKTKPEVFFEKLQPLGFIYKEINAKNETMMINQNEFVPNVNPELIVVLDVRESLEKGIDPFKTIMQSIDGLPKNHILKLVNTFEPVPLIGVLKRKGFIHAIERKDDLVYTYFKFDENSVTQKINNNSGEIKLNTENFDNILSKYANNILYIDVRELEMPMPMVTILNEIEKLSNNQLLFVHHKKVPMHLLPELKNRGFEYAIKQIDENYYHVLIYKK